MYINSYIQTLKLCYNKVMKTIIKKVSKTNLACEQILEAGAILKNGGLVAFPTETVYGLGANALDDQAAMRTYAAKGRPSDNPLIVHIADVASVAMITNHVSIKAEQLIEQFWPGPLTLIFHKKDNVPLGTTGGLETVAVRFPKDEIAQAVILAGGGFISAPSANTSGKPSPTLASHVMEDLAGKIDMILDGGAVDIGVESTIVDMTVEPPMILRPGAITKEMIEQVIGVVEVDRTLLEGNLNLKPKAPGMKYRHYAPKSPLVIIEGENEKVVQAINIKIAQAKNQRVGVIASKETMNCYKSCKVKNIGSRYDKKTIAHNLYKTLREFDNEQVEIIYSESFDIDEIGVAIMNRLGKAAGQCVVQAEEIIKCKNSETVEK